MDKILKDKKAIFIFIAPALIMFILILVIPIFQMVYYSLCDYAALTPPEFIGLANYKKLFFKDATFRTALKNSIFFMLFSAVTQQVIGILLAVFLTNIPKGRNVFKNIYYLPSVLHVQPEDRYQPAAGAVRNQGTAVADGFQGIYRASDVGHRVCGTVAVRRTEYDALYGADHRHIERDR